MIFAKISLFLCQRFSHPILQNHQIMRFLHCCFWLSALTILSSLSCKKGDNTDDAPVGNGTFTCLLNGEQWKPCLKDEFIPGGGLAKLTVNTNDQRILKIMAIRNCKDGQDESLRINCSSIADDLSIGKWSMNLTDRLGCGKKDYQLDSCESGAKFVTD